MIDKATKKGREILLVRVCSPSLGVGTERFALNKPHESLLRASDHIEQAPTGHPSASVAVADR